jgi:hypothetical protein
MGWSQAGSALATSSSVHVSHRKAIVIGGIVPCEGRVIQGGPRYAAGTVTVLAGQVERHGSHWILPKRVEAKARVATNARYRFVLPPGAYMLRARFPPPANVHPFMQVTLKAGTVVYSNIPNMCL